MKKISVFKASETLPKNPVESVEIKIDIGIDVTGCKSVEDYNNLYELESDNLANALIYSLPGGTLDRLLVKLLQHKATSFKAWDKF